MPGHSVSTIWHILGIFGVMWHASRFAYCGFWKPAIRFVLVVTWKYASISRRFPVICEYPFQWDFQYVFPKMADFGRPIPPNWTNFNLTSISQTEVSLRCLAYYTPQCDAAVWKYCTLCALLEWTSAAAIVDAVSKYLSMAIVAPLTSAYVFFVKSDLRFMPVVSWSSSSCQDHHLPSYGWMENRLKKWTGSNT